MCAEPLIATISPSMAYLFEQLQPRQRRRASRAFRVHHRATADADESPGGPDPSGIPFGDSIQSEIQPSSACRAMDRAPSGMCEQGDRKGRLRSR